ncbi:MAG: TerC family protein [bacterium]
MVARLSVGLLLPLLVAAVRAEERDVVLVLDNSSIMKRVDAKGLASPSVGRFVEKLEGDVRAAIVLFDRSATVSVPLTAVTDESRPEFLEALQQLDYRGEYPDIAIALEQAIRELEVSGRVGAEKSIILLTGGLLNPGDTALAQSRLRALGYDVGPIDGIMGPEARGAIRQFQRQMGIPGDAELSKTLLVRLEEAYGARWQGELAAKAAGAGIKVIAVVWGEDSPVGQALVEKTSEEYFRIPNAEVPAGVFERLSSAFGHEAKVPGPLAEAPAIEAPERVGSLPTQPAEVALPEERPEVMEWLTDPTIWVGLLTLVVLEIILGIDNLIFIAILADKLPPEERDKARRIGLALAAVMRLGLLASISWVMSLTAVLFRVFSLEISWRDIILIAGGIFLLLKATIEMHERLEAAPHEHAGSTVHAAFWPVVVQIVILDAVFSLDSVITAVGMVDELYVMMAAVVIAVTVMLVASKPLSVFVNAHPSVVILCLGFLLMVGFVLVVDGLGYHVPKGYLYTAIAFSVVIETFNQLALRNRRKLATSTPFRQRTADAVLRLLGGIPLVAPAVAGEDASMLIPEKEEETFASVEKEMVRGVLTLADRPVQAIMTPRPEVIWLDPADPKESVLAEVRNNVHRQFLMSRGSIDNILGIARKEDILDLCLRSDPFDVMRVVQQPVAVHEGTSILKTLDLFKRAPLKMALVVDEYGGLQGIVTLTDLLEAIAGDLPDEENEGNPSHPYAATA